MLTTCALPICPGKEKVDVVDLVSADLEEVAQKCGLSYKALVALRRVLLAQFSAFPFNGADLYEELKTSTAILSTGVGSLDKLLDAGLYTGEVTEIAGAPGSGKTQVCLCVAANVAHGLQQNVLYIDSNGGLTASRILQLLQARTPDEEEQAGALQRIQVVRAFDIFQMLDVLQDLRGAVSQQVRSSSGTLKVVVVDSVAAVVAPLLGGQQREGLALMMQLARELKTLARDLSVAVLVRLASHACLLSGPWTSPSGEVFFLGDQSHDPRQGQRAAQTCPGTLLELRAQHPASPGQCPRLRSSGQPTRGVSDQIPPSANRLPGDGGLRELGDPSVPGRSQRTLGAEPSVPGRSHMMVLLMGKGTDRKAPSSPARQCPLLAAGSP
ncbi:DNA repair protein RAD51 homolog 4 isoform X2 [Odocoileus virginianus]|uniref:DNA repair protein RAD51 homolog 4 isoform X2 n=1 Tax=Odocoileus virginianus TaxID=9874 RepID=A0ABM4J3X4_ODOVR